MRTVIADNHGQVEAILYEDVNHSEIVGALSIPLRKRFRVTDDISKFLNSKKTDELYNNKLDELLLSE